MKKSKNGAFTLVELSIVLVIIGLLTAGVVGGQSLIESSKRNSVISSFNSYKTAFLAYELEYDAIPGDHKDASSYWPTAVNGNGDKYLASLPINHATIEGKNAWIHLANAGLTKFTPTGNNATNTIDAGSNPATPYENVVYGLNRVWLFNRKFENAVNMVELSNTVYMDMSTIKVKDAIFFDKKMDDGEPDSGSIFTFQRHSTSTTTCINKPYNTFEKVSYVTSNMDSKACVVNFYLK